MSQNRQTRVSRRGVKTESVNPDAETMRDTEMVDEQAEDDALDIAEARLKAQRKKNSPSKVSLHILTQQVKRSPAKARAKTPEGSGEDSEDSEDDMDDGSDVSSPKLTF